jgi:hypothetical protein
MTRQAKPKSSAGWRRSRESRSYITGLIEADMKKAKKK